MWKGFGSFASKSSAFSVCYGIDVSNIPDLNLKNPESAYVEVFQRFCAPRLSPEWIAREDQVKHQALQAGRLLSAEIVFEPSNGHIKILTSWRDKESFHAYYSKAQLYKLDEAFQLGGLHPRVFNAENIFPQLTGAERG